VRTLGEALRDAEDPRTCVAALQAQLSRLTGMPAALLLVADDDTTATPNAQGRELGELNADERAGLQLSLTQNRAMGPGTGRHEEQPAWYLPLRGRRSSFGAALLRLPEPQAEDEAGTLRAHAQALCDQMGLAMERARATAAAQSARSEAQAHQLRSTLLAAISHDYRTPLATILGAASSLQAQDERLSSEQRRRLATTIVDETEQLASLAANTLQLARLDTPGLVLQLEWESPEEIIGALARRVRQRHPARRIVVRAEPALPLLRCDAVLLVQLLENLVDNALKYGGEEALVEVVVRVIGPQMVLAVRDRGPGVAPAWRERIFEVFQRGQAAPSQRGAGVGLAVCRAIARAHGGEMRLRARSHGGSSFECVLPLSEQPPAARGAEEGVST
jgi:two-component system sensor histidine kinase KdpD